MSLVVALQFSYIVLILIRCGNSKCAAVEQQNPKGGQTTSKPMGQAAPTSALTTHESCGNRLRRSQPMGHAATDFGACHPPRNGHFGAQPTRGTTNTPGKSWGAGAYRQMSWFELTASFLSCTGNRRTGDSCLRVPEKLPGGIAPRRRGNGYAAILRWCRRCC